MDIRTDVQCPCIGPEHGSPFQIRFASNLQIELEMRSNNIMGERWGGSGDGDGGGGGGDTSVAR